MRKLCIFLTMFVFCVTIHASDSDIVAGWISAYNLSTTLEKSIVIEDGRVVELNLNNEDFGKDGLTEVPENIGELTNLRKLSVNDNSIRELPPQLFTLKNLKILCIASNKITEVGEGLGNLSELVELDIRNNQIKALPQSIGNLKKLVKLQTWGNNYTNLPESISGLVSLRELYLKGNRLVDLPLSITKLNLTYLDVLDNKICNPKPAIHKWLLKYDPKYQTFQKCVGEKRFQ